MAAEAVGALGAINEGKAGKLAGDYNAQVAENNAVYSRQQATEEERRSRSLARKAIGEMRAGYGASGITLQGSAMDVLEESAFNAELDALTIRAGGEAKAAAYRNEARMERIAGKNAMKAAKLRAAGLLIQGGQKAAMQAMSAGAGG